MLLFILQCLVERRFACEAVEAEDFDEYHYTISQAVMTGTFVDGRNELIRWIDSLYLLAWSQDAKDYLDQARDRAYYRRAVNQTQWQYCLHCGHEVRSNIRRGVVELYEVDDERLRFW